MTLRQLIDIGIVLLREMLSKRPKFFCRFGWHAFEEVWIGYPAWSQHLQTKKVCVRCDVAVVLTDSLFAPMRPETFPLSKDYIIYRKGEHQ